jgi:hypothetical protein
MAGSTKINTTIPMTRAIELSLQERLLHRRLVASPNLGGYLDERNERINPDMGGLPRLDLDICLAAVRKV